MTLDSKPKPLDQLCHCKEPLAFCEFEFRVPRPLTAAFMKSPFMFTVLDGVGLGLRGLGI